MSPRLKKQSTRNSVTEWPRLIHSTIRSRIKRKFAVIPSAERTLYSKILSVPTEIRKIMQETQNDEKVQKIEQEKRSQNFIIHGADEIGENSEDIKNIDVIYIKDIL